ncbi:ABC transporter permease [Nocardia rhamnosiphila]|uniref:Transport permease protein n=1 Tax=Nocardia rhamnosiphila TaxID=426716 RepID=A0ABV2WSY4_9NOCA|nr:ABC transporter permease [Nocardia rhamnosiphila]
MTTTEPRRNIVADTLLVTVRELRPVLGDPFSVVFGLIQPLFFLLLFGPLLARDGESPWAWFVPGILVMTSLFGTAGTGSNLQLDLHNGTHERLLVTPLSRSALFLGRAVKEFLPLIAQATLIILVTIPLGLRPDPLGAVQGLLLLGVLGLGIGSFSYALAIVVREQDWVFWTVHQTLLFPAMILSGMLLPLEQAPGWMRALSVVNPLTHVVNAERDLFAGRLTSADVGWGWLAAILTAAIGIAVGLRALRKSTRP